MKIERRNNDTTIIKHFPLLVSAMILLLAFIVLRTLAAPLLQTPARYNTLHVGIIALLFALAFAHFLWECVRFEFDSRRRVIVWRHKLLTGTTGGKLSFDDVTDVVAETMTSSDNHSRLTRVALVTKNGRLPLTNVYGGDHKESAQTIREILKLDDSAKQPRRRNETSGF